ncbi:unnamed protein product [Boreogadus saida]
MTPRDILQHPLVSLLPEYYGHSFSQHHNQHYRYQYSEQDKGGDWARCQSAASPSQHHDQHSHYQEFGKDKEEGEENLRYINSREEEVNRQKEEGRDISCKGEGRQLEGGVGWRRRARPQQFLFPPDTHPWIEELEGHLLSVSD